METAVWLRQWESEILLSFLTDLLAHKIAQLTTTVLSLVSIGLMLHTEENLRKRTTYAS